MKTIIMYDLTTLTKIIFEKKNHYPYIPDNDKDKLFFPFNRYMARAIPLNADALNSKGIDGSSAMDLWFNYAQRTLLVPKWFYPKFKKDKKVKKESYNISDQLDEVDKNLLMTFYPKYLERLKVEEERMERAIIVKKIKKA